MKTIIDNYRKYIVIFLTAILMFGLIMLIRVNNRKDYFYLEALENTTIKFDKTGTLTTIPSLEYTIDNQIEYRLYTIGQSIELKKGQKIYFRGNNQTFSEDEQNYINIDSSGIINAGGNVMSLIDKTCKLTDLSETKYVFSHLFFDCSSLKSIDNLILPATTLADGCYELMFEKSGLINIPENLLPAENLATDCYYRMFANTPINSIPENLLQSQHLAEHCYNRMFYGCDCLLEIPSKLLPATVLAPHCYKNMFQDCINIKEIPSGLLQSTELKPECYYGMFCGCSSLLLIPSDLLPATTLADGCYEFMFKECSSIKLSSKKTDKYKSEFRIPSSSDGTTAHNAMYDMFHYTNGTFKGEPEINKIYYLWVE